MMGLLNLRISAKKNKEKQKSSESNNNDDDGYYTPLGRTRPIQLPVKKPKPISTQPIAR